MKVDFKLGPGLNRMRATRQPGMVVILKTWCPVCSELKASLTSSREIDYLSNYMVMVMLKDEDEPQDGAFAPDGSYIPRVFFLSPNGQIMYDVINSTGDPRYRYFYTSVKQLVHNMRRVINFFPAGLKKVAIKQKPGMIVCHKAWCGACRNLRPKFEASKEIENLSTGFVLISLADDNQPEEEKYMPDGDYVPRIMFLNPQGVLLLEVINEGGSPEYKYFYSDAESIARSMKTVLLKFSEA